MKFNQVDQLIKDFCSEDWVLLLNERVTEVNYKAKSIIVSEGDPIEHITLVKQGKVKIYCSYDESTERIYRFATNGQVIGHRGLGGNHTLPITAYALTDTTVAHIPLSLFNSLLKANALFCYHFMLFLAEELRESEKHMKELVNMNLRQRVAIALKMNADAFGFDKEDDKKLAYTISRKDISHLAATTYESVIRTLSDFQKEKLIALVNKEIRILDFHQLLAIIENNTHSLAAMAK